MFAKLFMPKATPQYNEHDGNMTPADLHVQVPVHYGIPHTASIMAFDPIQCLLAVGTLDGRIKVFGGENTEALFMSPKQLPYKYLEFLSNKGFLVGVSNENDIQIWDLENWCLSCSFHWESNITAFSIIQGTSLMYSGDEDGLISVLKFDSENGKILQLSYTIPVKALKEAASISFSNSTSVVGILQQPCSSGKRVLIAYEDGVMILWDVSENQIVSVRGHKHLHLKGKEYVDSSGTTDKELEGTSDSDQEEKEICSLCWISTTRSILAVGYIDGDILLWDWSSGKHLKSQHPGTSSNDVFKLQLSSADRRLPVIVLHWSTNNSDTDHGGQLFVYGGDEIGSEEVLTILSLDWSSGIETVKCVARMELTLHGSFADMILLPKTSIRNASAAAVFILTNPGQIHVYDVSSLSSSRSQEAKHAIQASQFPVAIPTSDPGLTVAKICLFPVEGDSCRIFPKKTCGKRIMEASIPSLGSNWPLTGGVNSELSFPTDGSVIIYIVGYQDGSIRIWGATSPVFTLIHVIDGKLNGLELDGVISSISALDLSSASASLAVGNESGLVCIYKLHGDESSGGLTTHLVTETKCEVHTMHHESGYHCSAVFWLSSSAVSVLHFTKSGAKLAVGFQSGHVLMLDAISMSVLYHVDCSPITGSPIISLGMQVIMDMDALINNPKRSCPRDQSHMSDVLFVLGRNAHVALLDISGNFVSPHSLHPKEESIAIAMYVIGRLAPITELGIADRTPVNEITGQKQNQEDLTGNESGQSHNSNVEQLADAHPCDDSFHSEEISSDAVLLLCCEDALRLYPLKSVVQGDNSSINKVKLSKLCCWSTIIKSKVGRTCGLLMLYNTGVFEIRSLPELKVIEENSLMSILRWNFKTNMQKTICSSENGHIALVNGSELAFVSTLARVNDFRIPESLPVLHDKVLAAAADAAISLQMFQKKKQVASSGILGGLIKGFRGGKAEHSHDSLEQSHACDFVVQMESYFSRTPFSATSTSCSHDEVELNIDDVDIDEIEIAPNTSSSLHVVKQPKKLEDNEREKLFQGGKSDMKPRPRTPQEILTQYKFAGDAAAAAAYARDKLAQRQEKLEKIRERTEELQNGAENFASMANELAKAMQAKKWWKL